MNAYPPGFPRHATLPLLVRSSFPPLRRDIIDTLQVKLGYRCNQSGLHCHVNAGPNRTEEMSADTNVMVVDFLAASADLRTLDNGCRVGVVQGDADSLADWRFDVAALADPAARPGLPSAFEQADVDLFASSYTCLPVLRHVPITPGRAGCVVNTGAAGMPNFKADLAGLCTRISTVPSPYPVLHETRVAGAYVVLRLVRLRCRALAR